MAVECQNLGLGRILVKISDCWLEMRRSAAWRVVARFLRRDRCGAFASAEPPDGKFGRTLGQRSWSVRRRSVDHHSLKSANSPAGRDGGCLANRAAGLRACPAPASPPHRRPALDQHRFRLLVGATEALQQQRSRRPPHEQWSGRAAHGARPAASVVWSIAAFRRAFDQRTRAPSTDARSTVRRSSWSRLQGTRASPSSSLPASWSSRDTWAYRPTARRTTPASS